MVGLMVETSLVHVVPCAPTVYYAFLLLLYDLVDPLILLLTPVTVLAVLVLCPSILNIATVALFVLVHVFFLLIDMEKRSHHC
jgi:hypothetical protein